MKGHSLILSTSKQNHAPLSLEDTIKLLKVSADTKNLKLGKMIHAHLTILSESPQNENIAQTNSLINFYAKCDQIPVARQLFDNMHHRNVVSYSSLMSGYLHYGFSLENLKLFKSMVSVENMRPNEYIFATVLFSCSRSSKVEEGKQCHGYVMKSGLAFHQYVRSALIDLYAKCQDMGMAMQVFNALPGYDVFSYNSILNGLLEHGYMREGVEVLSRMVNECVNWDTTTYVNAFGICACLKDLKLGLQVHGQMLKNDVQIDAFISSAMINMYGKCEKISNARKVFDGLKTRNVVLWTSMLASFFQNGYYEEALNFYNEMEEEGIQPNELTFAVLLNSAAGLSTVRYGDVLHALVEKSGFKENVIVGNALITMYEKGGIIEAAFKVFSNMIYRDTITWNAMICGYSHHGLGREALIVFQEMLAAEECPNHVTFVGVLSACGHLGLVQEGFYYLNQVMNKFEIKPGLEHYTCIVGLLSKAGLLDEAENFMRCTLVKWDVVAWRTLLNASHVHQNYGFARRIAEFILKMDHDDVGTYTLLSNIYAKKKRWDGVSKIRKLMRDRNIKKEPGVSWIEIKNATHVFVSEDINHPESSQIYEKVKELLAKIKPLGYIPDVAAVLHDVEDEQKEEYLSYHSEKLAIAYGLMKTSPGAPIRIIKNLRMCDDCHSAVKLISKLTNRDIIVRDANRFHRFQDGCCSCANYW
ncbi:pentatricopeptide repeat-containing protein At5g39680 [Pistacia vera]|uniref:pentatricopeptide repeat-containing protein At5g39680 n=1 Tax=Pistacia vera TaxID=55513 RepID=UPI001262FBF1|nr:pentatricopeptide repeat-containing protein At5g39680 [Pistacia vera]